MCACAVLGESKFFHLAKIPMRDGVSLAANIYLPSNRADKVGCLMQFSPYRATDSDKPWAPDRAEEWGVATMSVDCRGLCNSEGVFEPFHNQLIDDAEDLLKWIAAQDWSNGRVVMTGGSYPGATQLACMKSGHPALVACAPSVVTFFPYTINYANGVLIPQFFKGWHSGLAGDASWEELGKHTDRDDPYWDDRSSLGKLSESKGRAFYQAGWFDMLGIATFDSLNLMPEGSFLRIGPWSHGVNTFDNPDIDYSKKNGSITEDLEIDFLRSALEGRAPETSKLPGKILMYVMGRNEWRYENEWPLKRMTPRNLYFGKDFSLSFDAPAENGSDKFAYDPENPVPSKGGRIIHAGGQYDQTDIEKRDDVLCYTTAPLDDDLEVIGDVLAAIRASSSAAVADVAVKLVDVYPDGRPFNVVDGIMRGKFAKDGVTSLNFRVDITGYCFLKGHRIRVEIAGSNSPHYAKADAPAVTALIRGGENGSHLVLPVIPR